MKPNSAEIVFVVDRSGSMQPIAADMRGGFDAFVREQRKTPGECKVTLAQFDGLYELVYEGLPLAKVPPLSLVPRGSTALLDAVGRTINATGARLAAMPESQRPSHVLFVIITDGQENASKEFTLDAVSKLITQQRDVYKWEFTFLGADLNAIEVAQSMGVMVQNAAMYSASPKGMRAAMASVNAVSRQYRGGAGGQSLFNVQDVYDSAVKEEE